MLLLYTIIYLVSSVLYLCKYNIISSALLGAFVIFYIIYNIKNKSITSLLSLFTIGFVGGFSISLLKLSNLSSDYSIKTLMIIYLSYFSFYLGYSMYHKRNVNKDSRYNMINIKENVLSKIILIIICVSIISFIIEAIKLRYIPILSIGVPHAYSEFHIFMIHYFTTSFVLLPTICAVSINTHIKNGKKALKKNLYISIIGLIFSILMPIILVSRFQLIFSIITFIFAEIFLYYSDNKKNGKDAIKYLPIAIVSFLIIYILITIARSHSISYLNDIFDMKDKNMPIFITQPYIYISQNFENLNYMINNLPFFSYGRRMLSPLFSLTFVKNLFPHITTAAPLIIKDELTTNTLIYDFYYDFSFFGVCGFCMLMGYLFRMLEVYVYSRNNNILTMLLYTQMSFYMLFSFFQTFFSLSQTFIYMILSVFIYFIYMILCDRKVSHE